LKGFKIPILELDGYEADDIIGTLAKQAGEEGYKVYMITPDKDYGQLVTTLQRQARRNLWCARNFNEMGY